MLRQAISTKAGQWASYFVQMSRRRAYAHLRASSTHVHTESSTENNATEQKKQLVLLDFLPLVYKSYYASKYLDISLPFSQVFGPEGAFATDYDALGSATKTPTVPLSTVFFFTKSIVQLVSNLEHDTMICANDGPTNDRKTLFPSYKEGRSPMPQELKQQIPLCLEVLDSVGIPVIAQPGVEADDLLATAATHYGSEDSNWEVVVVSPDKDLLQIVTETDSIRVYNVHKQQHVDYQGAVDYFGVEPDLIPQVQSLAGDKVDGIPGIPGVGLKTAAKLLRKYGTVAEIVRQAESGGLTPKLSQNITEHAEMLPMYLELVTLRLDAEEALPPRLAVQEVAPPNLSSQLFLDILQRLNFKSVAKTVEKLNTNEASLPELDSASEELPGIPLEEEVPNHSLDDDFFFAAAEQAQPSKERNKAGNQHDDGIIFK